MPLALKFKFISTERWEPKQNERGQAECKQNKKSYWPKESNSWNLSIHKKTKKKKKSERHKYDADHHRVRVRETNATMNYFP